MIPLIEGFIGDRTLLLDQSLRELRPPSENAPTPPEVRAMDVPRLLRFPFAYIWIAFGLLVALVLWAYLGRSDHISAGPSQGLRSRNELRDRRSHRFSQLWAGRVPEHMLCSI